MATLDPSQKLTDQEKALVDELHRKLIRKRRRHLELDRYYRGIQHVQTLGLAVPPELRGFEFPLNWPRVTVDAIEHRQDIKGFLLPGEQTVSPALREGWEANNLDSESSLVHKDALIQGHAFVSVSTNEEDTEHPLIHVEPSRQMIAKIDPRLRRMVACLRLYASPENPFGADAATLYLPDQTVWLTREGAGPWTVVSRDHHNLGRVPVVLFLNRRRAGDWTGETEMSDVLKPTDMAARALMNLQVAMETHSVPSRWVVGASKSDFVDPKTGEPLDTWKAYMTAMHVADKHEARFGQFAASDLKNFETVITILSQQVSALTGLPMRYFGQNPANPAAEGAIRADESRLVKNVERKNRDFGDAWGWVMGLYERFRTGSWPAANRIRTEWHDPGTPTFAQKADALQKLSGGAALISREGVWDELGWGEARKDRERGYFRAELDEQWGAPDDEVKEPASETARG